MLIAFKIVFFVLQASSLLHVSMMFISFIARMLMLRYYSSPDFVGRLSFLESRKKVSN
ncbi:hypothetical protein Hanom_Chr11g01025031 [Helianthus anomalus]